MHNAVAVRVQSATTAGALQLDNACRSCLERKSKSHAPALFTRLVFVNVLENPNTLSKQQPKPTQPSPYYLKSRSQSIRADSHSEPPLRSTPPQHRSLPLLRRRTPPNDFLQLIAVIRRMCGAHARIRPQRGLRVAHKEDFATEEGCLGACGVVHFGNEWRFGGGDYGCEARREHRVGELLLSFPEIGAHEAARDGAVVERAVLIGEEFGHLGRGGGLVGVPDPVV